MDINGIYIDFDFTSPADMQKYTQAAEIMKAKAGKIPEMPTNDNDPEFLQKYIDGLNKALKVYGDFIDDAFGNGTATKLLGNNPSITQIANTMDAINAAVEQQGRELGKKMSKYAPNRLKPNEHPTV